MISPFHPISLEDSDVAISLFFYPVSEGIRCDPPSSLFPLRSPHVSKTLNALYNKGFYFCVFKAEAATTTQKRRRKKVKIKPHTYCSRMNFVGGERSDDVTKQTSSFALGIERLSKRYWIQPTGITLLIFSFFLSASKSIFSSSTFFLLKTHHHFHKR